LYVSVDRALDKLVILKFSTEHNHTSDATTFANYPEVQRLSVDEHTEAGRMMRLGISVKKLQVQRN